MAPGGVGGGRKARAPNVVVAVVVEVAGDPAGREEERPLRSMLSVCVCVFLRDDQLLNGWKRHELL